MRHWTPASMAAMNGTRCTACISPQSDSITGSPRCASTPACPLPGKCFAQAETPAIVVRRDQQPAVEGALETGEQALEPLGGLEVPAIEDEAACPRVREEADVGIRGTGPRQAEHQPAADQLIEGHRAHR